VRFLRAAARGVWEFVVGDDWRTAIGVVLGLGLTSLLPAAVPAILGLSLRRGSRR
jgi:hypothetical protein